MEFVLLFVQQECITLKGNVLCVQLIQFGVKLSRNAYVKVVMQYLKIIQENVCLLHFCNLAKQQLSQIQLAQFQDIVLQDVLLDINVVLIINVYKIPKQMWD